MDKKGFTLLEVLLTIIIMAAGFVVLLQALSIGLFAGGENETELIAVNLAQEKMEELRNKSYPAINDESRATLANPFQQFDREIVVTEPQTGLKQINVTVYWFTKSAESNTSLVTYVSDI